MCSDNQVQRMDEALDPIIAKPSLQCLPQLTTFYPLPSSSVTGTNSNIYHHLQYVSTEQYASASGARPVVFRSKHTFNPESQNATGFYLTYFKSATHPSSHHIRLPQSSPLPSHPSTPTSNSGPQPSDLSALQPRLTTGRHAPLLHLHLRPKCFESIKTYEEWVEHEETAHAPHLETYFYGESYHDGFGVERCNAGFRSRASSKST
jgi:hypothetical protein